MINSAEDLRTRIRELGEVEPDPTRVAGKILESITPAEAVVIVGVTLQNYVRLTLVRPPFSEPVGKHEPSEPKTYRNREGKEFVSAKSASISDWAAQLKKIVNVAEQGGKSWKFFGKCNHGEVLHLADNRDRKASEIAAEAKRYLRVAEAMATHKKNLVEELPEEVLEELLGR